MWLAVPFLRCHIGEWIEQYCLMVSEIFMNFSDLTSGPRSQSPSASRGVWGSHVPQSEQFRDVAS